MRDAPKLPDVVTGYLEGSAPSLICLVWFGTPRPDLRPSETAQSLLNLILDGGNYRL